MDEENIPVNRPFRVHHPLLPHVLKTYPAGFKIQPLMVPIFKSGRLVYQSPTVKQIREYTLKNLRRLDNAYKRFKNPHQYHISLSSTLFKVKQRLLRQVAAHSQENHDLLQNDK